MVELCFHFCLHCAKSRKSSGRTTANLGIAHTSACLPRPSDHLLCRHAFNTQFLCDYRNPTRELPSVVRQEWDVKMWSWDWSIALFQVGSLHPDTGLPLQLPLQSGVAWRSEWWRKEQRPKHLTLIGATHLNLRVFLLTLENTNINSTPTNTPTFKPTGGYYQSDLAPVLLQ